MISWHRLAHRIPRMVENGFTPMAGGWLGVTRAWSDLVSLILGLIDMVVSWEAETQYRSIFQTSLVLHLIMSPWPKLLMWLKSELSVRELPNDMTSGWVVILSIFAEKCDHKHLFSLFSFLVPLPYHPVTVICNRVCMCEHVFLCFCRGFGIGVAIKMNWESMVRTCMSPPL